MFVTMDHTCSFHIRKARGFHISPFHIGHLLKLDHNSFWKYNFEPFLPIITVKELEIDIEIYERLDELVNSMLINACYK